MTEYFWFVILAAVVVFLTFLIVSIFVAFSSYPPCEKLILVTFNPAFINFVNISSLSLAGPIVPTIFVLLKFFTFIPPLIFYNYSYYTIFLKTYSTAFPILFILCNMHKVDYIEEKYKKWLDTEVPSPYNKEFEILYYEDFFQFFKELIYLVIYI